MAILRRARGIISSLMDAGGERLLSSMPPSAVGATQRVAEQVLRRAADRWPQLGRFLGTQPPVDTWRPPAWPGDDTDHVFDHVVATSKGSQPPGAPRSTPPRASSAPVPPAGSGTDRTVVPVPGAIGDASATDVSHLDSPSLIEQARTDSGWQARRDAVRALASRREPEVGDALFSALADGAAEVAAAAVEALAAWAPASDERVTRALVETLSSEHGFRDPLVRAMAAGALGGRLTRDEGEPLLDAVGDANAEVSVAAIAALAQGGFEGAEERLVGVLEEPTGFYVSITRHAAARGLALLESVDLDRIARIRLVEQDAEVRDALPELR